jgi:hypothetical protein
MEKYMNRKFNQENRLRYDQCEEKSIDEQNKHIANYWLKTNERIPYDSNFVEHIGMMNQSFYNVNSVSHDSELRNGKLGNQLTSEKNKQSKLLEASPFKTTPYLGAGRTSIVRPDVYSNLVQSKLTQDKKSVSPLSGVTIDRFIPLVPCIKENIQNPTHIIPKYWVRGGMSTRSIIQNIDYIDQCKANTSKFLNQ